MNPTHAATALIRHYAGSPDPDQRTSMDDARIALCIAQGVDLDDIDPTTGYNYSRNAYDTVRASWILFLRDNGWSDYDDKHGRLDPEHTYAKWAQHRPQFTTGDDWLAAGIAAHRERHTGTTCFRNGRCDFHPDADHLERMRLIVEGYCQVATELDRYGNAVTTCDAPAVEHRPDHLLVRYVCADHR